MLVKTNTFARKCIIHIGKYIPFLVVALVTFSNLETFYAWLFERYIEIDGTTDNDKGKEMMGELSKVCDKLKVAGTFAPHIEI